MSYSNIKRFFDLFFALIVLIIVSPLLIITITLLYIELSTFPLFIQARPGKNERIFNLIKLKTMTDERDFQGNLLPDIERLHRFGKIVRKLSIDELPQLVNVVKGEMSLVGPRPLLIEYLPLYSETQKKRHLLKPGITGWAQVNGRNLISWQEKFELDIFYYYNQSFVLDTKILIFTIIALTIPKGINKNQEITMEYFSGNE